MPAEINVIPEACVNLYPGFNCRKHCLKTAEDKLSPWVVKGLVKFAFY